MLIKSAIAKTASGVAIGTLYITNLIGLVVAIGAWFTLGWPEWLILVLGGVVFVFGLWDEVLLGLVVTVACFVAGEWVWGVGIVAANLLLPYIKGLLVGAAGSDES